MISIKFQTDIADIANKIDYKYRIARVYYLRDLYDKYTKSTFPQNYNMMKAIVLHQLLCDEKIDFVK